MSARTAFHRSTRSSPCRTTGRTTSRTSRRRRHATSSSTCRSPRRRSGAWTARSRSPNEKELRSRHLAAKARLLARRHHRGRGPHRGGRRAPRPQERRRRLARRRLRRAVPPDVPQHREDARRSWLHARRSRHDDRIPHRRTPHHAHDGASHRDPRARLSGERRDHGKRLCRPGDDDRDPGRGRRIVKGLWRWGAVERARAIRAREVSSREAVQSSLARIDAVNPRVNAIVDLMADEALLAADKADAALKKDGALGALHGVPVTLKINVDVAGRPTTNGVVAFKDKVPSEESPCVIQWRNAGAIFVGRTNVPAFSTRYFTDNPRHGRALNPWDPKRTPGGSSGGAAAAVDPPGVRFRSHGL